MWWKQVKHVVMTKHPWDPGVGRRLRLFRISYSEDGSRLSSQIQSMWFLGPQFTWKSCITGDLCSGALGDLLPGNTIPTRCPAMVRIIKRNLNCSPFTGDRCKFTIRGRLETGKIWIPHSRPKSALSWLDSCSQMSTNSITGAATDISSPGTT